jgi:hypothetical protein
MIQQIHNDRCEFCREREALYVIPGPAGVMKACAVCKDRRDRITGAMLKRAS